MWSNHPAEVERLRGMDPAALLSSHSQQPLSAALLSSHSQLSSCCGQGLVVSYCHQLLSSCCCGHGLVVSYYHHVALHHLKPSTKPLGQSVLLSRFRPASTEWGGNKSLGWSLTLTDVGQKLLFRRIRVAFEKADASVDEASDRRKCRLKKTI